MIATIGGCSCKRFGNRLLQVKACPGLLQLSERLTSLAESRQLFWSCPPAQPVPKVLSQWACPWSWLLGLYLLIWVTRKYDIDCKSHDSGTGLFTFHSNFYYTGHTVAVWWMCTDFVQLQCARHVGWLCVGDGQREVILHGRDYGACVRRKRSKSAQEQVWEIRFLYKPNAVIKRRKVSPVNILVIQLTLIWNLWKVSVSGVILYFGSV